MSVCTTNVTKHNRTLKQNVFALQRLTEVYQDSGLGREALREIPMPHLRQKGLPYAPAPKAGSYNGPAALRLKPMSIGLPPMQPMVDVHDSLALSTWAAAGRHN